jgi:hypothetical protein
MGRAQGGICKGDKPWRRGGVEILGPVWFLAIFFQAKVW